MLLREGQLLFDLQLKLSDLHLQLLFLLEYLLDALLELRRGGRGRGALRRASVVRRSEDLLFQLLKLGNILLERCKLSLVL